ncbi:MAG: carboxy terminal-processing peptidase [Bacteroidia bacterium]|nr:carboxy terminal-processing peptidase [Bacteroidia bacterium]
MKRKFSWMLLAGTVVVLTSAFFVPYSKKEIVLNEAISQFLSYRHYQPLKEDDSFSERVFNLYIDRLDLNKRYFIQSDYEELSAYKLKIDNEWKERSLEFFQKSSNLIQKRLLETKAYYTEFLTAPFDLKKNETFETDPDKTKFPKDNAELRECWRKALKFQVMTRVAGNLQVQDEASGKSDTVKIKPVEQLEAEARKGLLDNYNDWYDRVRKIDEDDRWSIYINSVILAYDPHSVYMPPRDKERFDVAMSGKYEGIGATLRQKDGYLMVVDMFPGSPSWRSKKIEVNDLIMRVAQGDEPSVDILDMKQENAVALIKGPKNTKVRLTIHKRDGSVNEVVLTRAVVIMEESYAASLILKDASGSVRTGYIFLPQFYQDFQDRNGRKCADDVAREIDKLNAEGIDGLIIDLRNNGGGSLPEAVRMAGLFFPNGPVVQIKTKEGSPTILDDTDPKTQYGGPLVVMTNYSSASASEIFAAAIQDYGRGIIVGSPSTWGKGTVQRVTDLDEHVSDKYNDVKPLGALSLTIQKFYRINGKSTQLKGVTPDVVLPDSYQLMKIGEKEEEYALNWDEITPAKYTPWPETLPTDKVKKLSEKRINNDDQFAMIRENATRIKKDSERTNFNLNLDAYVKELKAQSQEARKFEKQIRTSTSLKIKSLESDLALNQADTARSEIMQRMIDELSKDIYLEEGVMVIRDLIKK